MKKLFTSFTSFNRTERAGLLVLLAIMVLLLLIKVTMHLWVHPDFDTAEEEKIRQAWQRLKDSQPAAALPQYLDLNTADSATLVRLKGIGPVTAHNIVQSRIDEPFTDIEELREVGNFSDSTFAYLKQHIRIEAVSDDE